MQGSSSRRMAFPLATHSPQLELVTVEGGGIMLQLLAATPRPPLHSFPPSLVTFYSLEYSGLHLGLPDVRVLSGLSRFSTI